MQKHNFCTEIQWCIKQERCLHSGTSVTAGKMKRVSLEASSVFHSQACTLFCMAVPSARVLNRAAFHHRLPVAAVCLYCPLVARRCNDILRSASLPHLAKQIILSLRAIGCVEEGEFIIISNQYVIPA